MNQPVLSHPVQRVQSVPESKAFDPWLLWVTVRRCWYWAVPVGLVLACVAGYAVLANFEPRYKATHLLEANEDFLLYKGVIHSIDDLAKTEKALFFNEIVLEPVLTDNSLRAAPSLRDPDERDKNLRDNLSISAAGSRARMAVSYEDSDREYAAKVCNAIVAAYMRHRDDFDQQRVAVLQDLLDPEIEHWKSRVEEHKQRVRELTILVDGYDPGNSLAVIQNENRLSLLDEYEREMNELQVELVVLENKLKIEESGSGEVSSDDVPKTVKQFIEPVIVVERPEVTAEQVWKVVDQQREVVEAKQQVDRFRRKAIAMEDLGTNRLYPAEYADAQKSREEWQSKLDELRENSKAKVVADLEEKAEVDYQLALKQRDQKIAALKLAFDQEQKLERQNRILQESRQRSETNRALRELIAEKTNRIEILQQHLDKEKAEHKELIDDSAELEFAKNDLQRAQDFLNQLQNRVAVIKTEGRQTNGVRSLSAAVPPKSPKEDIPYKKLLAASGVAFVIPLLLGLLWEVKTNRVTDSQVLEGRGGVAPVIGELARSPSTTAGRGSKGRRVFQESVDTLRANLFLSKQTKDSRSISIVSSMSGEGKSTAASQLAISLAKASGKTVLLIDADMRCPDQHEHFGVSLEPGLSGVLTDQASLDDAIQKDLGDLIHILPAGRLKASPHRLMSPEAMKSLVADCLERYEYVIFDTAPVLSAGETLAVAAATDITLVCAMRDVTRMDSVVRTTHRLESAGANVAGTVFSGVTPAQYAYRYGDYNYSNFAQLPGAPS